MPANQLTAKDVENAKPNPKAGKIARIPDGKGLWLEVRPSGEKFWRYRFKLPDPSKPNGVMEGIYTIGEAGNGRGQVSLAAARAERDKARELVKQGVNPTLKRKADRAGTIRETRNTFASIAEDWYAENSPEWVAHYAKQMRRKLDQVILPRLGPHPVRSVTSADVLALVKPNRKPIVNARLVLMEIGSIFRFAIAHQDAEDDPTYALRGTIKKRPVQHHQPLEAPEIPAFLASVRDTSPDRMAAIAMELLMLTFVRPGELAGAEWAEFNLDEALWIIPAARMKMRERHYVPLSTQAIALLRELLSITGNRAHLFPNARDPKRGMNPTTLNKIVARTSFADRFSPHACRATASTTLNGLGFEPSIIEKQLAHTERDQSRASYNHAAYMPERRAMMQTWANVVEGKKTEANNVVPIRAPEAA